MGKGTIGLNPFFHDGQIMSRSAMAGLLSVIISMTDAQSCKSNFRIWDWIRLDTAGLDDLYTSSPASHTFLFSHLTRLTNPAPLDGSLTRSHPQRHPLDALLARNGHVPPIPHHTG